MVLSSNGYTGEEKRKTCAKVKFSLGDISKVVVVIIGAIAWLVHLEATVQGNSKELVKVEKFPIQMAVMQNDITYIKEDVGELKDGVNEIKGDIKKILEKL